MLGFLSRIEGYIGRVKAALRFCVVVCAILMYTVSKESTYCGQALAIAEALRES